MANPNGNPANLRPWRPGQSGNPRGRPRGRTLTAILRDVLDSEEIDGKATPDGKDVARVFVEAVVGHAMRTGNPALVREILDRIDGKVSDHNATEDEGGGVRSLRAALHGLDDDPEMTPEEIAADDERIAREIIMRAAEADGLDFDLN